LTNSCSEGIICQDGIFRELCGSADEPPPTPSLKHQKSTPSKEGTLPLKQGLIQVYTGDGKGKTTAALGLAMRAAGQGLKVYIIQFMKGWPHYGELETIKLIPNITLRQFGRPDFVDRENPASEDIRGAKEALEEARRALVSGEYDLLILDELNVALDFGLLSLEEVLSLLEEKPPNVELVITGRNAHPEIIKRAHLVTEMKEIKHPYREGLLGRKGIEY